MSDAHAMLYAELEAAKRDVCTNRHGLETAVSFNPDNVELFRDRLEQAEARERDLVRQLAESTASKR